MKTENSQILVLYLNYGSESTINEKDGENRRSVVTEYLFCDLIIQILPYLYSRQIAPHRNEGQLQNRPISICD